MVANLYEKAVGCAPKLFELAWGLWLFSRVVLEGNIEGLPWFGIFKNLCLGGSVALALLTAFLHRRSVSWHIAAVWAAVLALAAGMRLTEGSWMLFTATLIVFAAWLGGFNYSRLFEVTVWALSLGVAFVVALAAFEVIPKGFIGIGSDRLRSSFGFQWPSRLPNYLLAVTMAYVCARKSVNSTQAALLGSFALVIYCDTDSRAPFLCTIAILVCVLTVERLPRFQGGWVPWACLAVLVIVFAGTFYLAAAYDPEVPWMASLNRIMSNRLFYSHNAFVSTGVLPFGSPLFSGEGVSPATVGYLDAGYLSLFFSYGWVFGLLFMAAFGCLVFWAARSRSWAMVACLLFVAVQGTMESKMLALQYTPFLLLLPNALGRTWMAIRNHSVDLLDVDPLAACEPLKTHHPKHQKK